MRGGCGRSCLLREARDFVKARGDLRQRCGERIRLMMQRGGVAPVERFGHSRLEHRGISRVATGRVEHVLIPGPADKSIGREKPLLDRSDGAVDLRCLRGID